MSLIAVSYPIIFIHGKFMNLLYQLRCTECNAFYIGETHHSLSYRMNGHRFTITVSNPDLPVAIHTQSHQITFQELSASYTNYQTPPQANSVANLKLHTNSSSNHDTRPDSPSINPTSFHPRHSSTYSFKSAHSLLFYCWGRPLWFGWKSTIFASFDLYMS